MDATRNSKAQYFSFPFSLHKRADDYVLAPETPAQSDHLDAYILSG